MAIEFQAAAFQGIDGANSASVNLTPAGVDRIVVIGTRWFNSANISSVTVGGNAATLIDSAAHTNDDRFKCALYYYVAPAASSLACVVNYGANVDGGCVAAVAYSGVDQSSPLATAASKNQGTGTTASQTVSSAVGRMVVALLGSGGDSLPTADGGQNSRTLQQGWNGSNAVVGISDEAGAASNTLSWTQENRDWMIIAAQLAAAGGGAAPVITGISDATLTHGQTGIALTGTGFGSSQGGGRVVVSPTDDIDDPSAVNQTVTAWSATEITFTAVLNSFAFGTLYVFVENDDEDSNEDGEAIARIVASATLNFTGTNKFINEDGTPAASKTGLTFYIWRAPRPPGSGGTPDQIIASVSTNGSGERSQAINLGSLDDGDTVYGILFGADGNDIFWTGEVLPDYA